MSSLARLLRRLFGSDAAPPAAAESDGKRQRIIDAMLAARSCCG